MTSPISHDEARKLLLKMPTDAEAEYLSLCRYVEQQRQANCAHDWRGVDAGRICANCLKQEEAGQA